MSQTLIISAGMPRAGSGWHYNLVHDLVVANGGQNARSIRERYHLQNFLTEVNCNISTLKFNRLFPVLIPTWFGNQYVIKTHAKPTDFTRWLISNGKVDTIYIYRDPRAALLSAYEYGKQGLVKNRPNAFSHLTSLDEAAKFMNFYVEVWETWFTFNNVLIVRYEDLIVNYHAERKRLVEYLNLDFNKNIAAQVFDPYEPGQGNLERIGTHFSKGEAERFRQVFTPSQLERYSDLFASVLQPMGYEH